MNVTRMLKCLVLGAAVASLASVAALAQDATTSAEVQAGGQTVTGTHDSSKFQQYEEIPNGLILFGTAFTWDSPSGYAMNFKGENFGYDDQWASFFWGKKGQWKLSVDWSQNPRWFSNTATTLYAETQPGVFILPTAVSVGLQGGADIRNYLNGSQPVELRYVRKTGKISFVYTGIEHWIFNASYQNEQRSGTEPLTLGSYFSVGNNTVEIAAPVDYRTNTFNGSAEYGDGKWFFSGGFDYSKFTNGVSSVLVDNPARYLDSTGAGSDFWRASLPPDNKAYNFSLAGGVNLPYHHRITANISWGRMTQDAGFLPYTANSAINALATFNPILPVASFDGRFDTFLGAFKVTGEPIQWFGYSVSYRAYEMDNKSPQIDFPNYVAGDSVAELGGPYTNDLIGYKKTTWGGEIHFDPVKQVRFGVEYTHDKIDHQFREYEDNTVKTWKGTLDLNFATWVSFRASYSDITNDPGATNEDAALNDFSSQYDIWRRDTTQYNALLTLTPTSDLAVSLSTQYSKDKYPDSIFGRTGCKYDNYGVDISYALGEKFSVYGSYMYEKYNYDMASEYRTTVPGNPLDNWWNNSEDKVDTYTLGVIIKPLANKCEITSDFTYSKGTSASGFTYVPGGAYQGDGYFPNAAGKQYFGYPDVFNKLTIWKTKFQWHFNKNLSAAVQYWWQKYEAANWATDVMQPYMAWLDPTANKSLYLSATVPDYNANIFRAFVSYKF